MRGTMHIEIRVPGRVRRGHVALARRLESLPASVSLHALPAVELAAARHLMKLENGLLRAAVDAHLPVDRLPADLSIVSGRTVAAGASVVVNLGADLDGDWHVTFDGQAGEQAMVASLARGRLPLVEIRDRTGALAVAGRPGTEQPNVLVTAYADVLVGLGTLLLAALGGRRLSSPAPDLDASDERVALPPGRLHPRSLPVTLARTTAGFLARRVYTTLYRTPHWRVGWRFIEPGQPDVLDLLAHPASGWRDLPDDGHHFYADPFPVVRGDETWLFVEDFDHRVGKGVISVVGFDDQGPVGTPTPVLRHDAHLSFPFVLEHDGEMWMIPETSGAGTVELYRARSFPHRWEREAVLLTGLEASDATVMRHGDRWLMLATVRSGGSFSDTLHAWSADRLTGPWLPHRLDPLLVDIASARPAGRVVARDGRLLRPVQDNRTGYGAALLLTEITRLDDDGFEQTVLASLGTSALWPGRRIHTLNRAGRLEVIDGSAMSARFSRRPRKPGLP